MNGKISMAINRHKKFEAKQEGFRVNTTVIPFTPSQSNPSCSYKNLADIFSNMGYISQV